MKFDRQFVLSLVIISLLGTGLLLQSYPDLAVVQIIASMAAVAIALGAVILEKSKLEKSLEEQEIAVENDLHLEPITNQEDRDLYHRVPEYGEKTPDILKHYGSQSRQKNQSKRPEIFALYANDDAIKAKSTDIYRSLPIVQDGNHFFCEVDGDSTYSLSVGSIDVEVSNGEAKVTMRQGRAPEIKSTLHQRPAKLHS